ncbi:MAG: hypothetical protein CMH22_05560 [Methylophaga sp.]|nr:hypothetical protein [Methylophaga sp.]|tara:strand:+ start:113562 stop:114302 length:741 start_codon:yes stop_codon:yes gene_type:complete
MEEEIWKDVPDYEGLYQASNLGRVKSLGRQVLKVNGVTENKPPKVLRQYDNGRGYKSVQLYKNKKSSRIYVHRLILITFEGLKEGLVVDHIDSDRSNNNLSNLRWCSQRENSYNSKRNNVTSKFKGVSKDSKCEGWAASIRIMQRKYYLGYFKSEIEASDSYNKALENWKNFSITPDGEKIEDGGTKIFNSKSKGKKGKSAKIVLDTDTGIYYDSLKEASYSKPQSYKYLSNAILHNPHKTSLRYV